MHPIAIHLVPDLPSTDELLPYLRRIDAARWYSNFGPLVGEFEEKLRAAVVARDPRPESGPISVATVVSGHSALEVGLRLLGVGPGKRVLLPAFTFPACPLAVERLGAEAALADVDQETWRLESETARAAAEHLQIDAVMPVAPYGVPVPIAQWEQFWSDTGIPVLIDAAAAFEKQLIPRCGLVAHSFHATKPLGIGEGGAIISRDPLLVERVRSYSNFGRSDGVVRGDGTNAKMSEYHAAVGLAQLRRWESIKLKRRRLLRMYSTMLAPFAGVLELQPFIEDAVVSLLMVSLQRLVAPDLMARIRHAGVAAHRTYLPPLYSHPHFRLLPVINTEGVELPASSSESDKCAHMHTSDWLGAHVLGLPFHHTMSESDVETTIDVLARMAGLQPTVRAEVRL